MDPKRKMSYNQIKMCMCVEYLVDIYGGYPNSTMLLDTYLSLETWKYVAREQGLSLFIFFSSLLFFRWASKYPLF